MTLRDDLNSIGHIFQAILKQIESIGTAQDLHLVYDSYLKHSIEESDSTRRMGNNAPLEYVDMSMKTPLPMQVDLVWSCSKNRENIQVLSREFFKDTV